MGLLPIRKIPTAGRDSQVCSRVESRPRRRSARHGDDERESGAVLILALVYIIVISTIVGALAQWTMNDLNNTCLLYTSRCV